MPLAIKETDSSWGRCYIWKIIEPLEFFVGSSGELVVDDGSVSNQWHPRRQLEWYAGRYLIFRFTGCPLSKIKIDPYGKPFLEDSLDHISLSHSGGWVGMISHDVPIGLDIQKNKGSISHLSFKFCLESDLDLVNPHFEKTWAPYVIWSAKEAIYKAYGKKQLDFKKHLLLDEAQPSQDGLTLYCHLLKDSLYIPYRVSIRTFGDLVLAKAVEES